MTTATGTLRPSGTLSARVSRAPRPKRARSITTPFGRVIVTNDKGSGVTLAKETLVSHLSARHFNAAGQLVGEYDLGSGLVTNCGVDLQALDFSMATAALKLFNFHALGTGTTAAAASDVVPQTLVPAASLTGSTNGYMSGTQSAVQPNIYQSVATFTMLAAGPTAITEWVLAMANFAPVNIVASGTTYSATGASFTALGSGPTVGATIVNLGTAANTPTTTPMGTITASTTTSVTIPRWNTLANASATTPTNATASQVVPTIWDHKVFAAINLSVNDSLQVTYQLTIASGG